MSKALIQPQYSPFLNGWDAAHDGYAIEDNPYDNDGSYWDWQRGWKAYKAQYN